MMFDCTIENLPEASKHQKWCCAEGCGECTPVQIDFEYYREEDRHGNLIESKSQKVWASGCCKSGLFLWDEDKQDAVDLVGKEKL